MRILISVDTQSFREVAGGSDYVCFCNSIAELYTSLSTSSIDVWICDGNEASSELLNVCTPKLLLVRDTQSIVRIQNSTAGSLAQIISWPEEILQPPSYGEQVLRFAEALYAQTRRDTEAQEYSIQYQSHQKTVILVGAGIMNLITAHYLIAHGYEIRIFDAGPDPRSTQDWTMMGTTHGGGDARMYTRTEADNYNEQDNQLYRNMESVFRRTVSQGGWSIKSPNSFTSAELDWVDAFETLPSWLARAFKQNMHDINGQAGQLWAEFMKSSPHLFQQVDLREDITRMYVEPDDLEAAIKLNHSLGTILKTCSLQELLEVHPTFGPAAAANQLAGGFTITGFTLSIHRFSAKLIDDIIAKGGKFQWNQRMSNIRRDTLGRVEGIETQEGELLQADHYVVSSGVSGDNILKGTASENLIQGVLGVWLQIPNLEPKLKNSFKLHRSGHVVEDINITVATDPDTKEDILIFGGGYGFVGLNRVASDDPQLNRLFEELENVARTYFPLGHSIAKQAGSLWPRGKYKNCLRPFTSTGLGVFESIPTTTGGSLIITGGNNTGGFAQAPAIARAVWRAFTGEHDDIHSFFHPRRGRPTNDSGYVRQLPQPCLQYNINPSKPPRVLLLCSDGPQYAYFRYRLSSVVSDCLCIMEPQEGQISHLMRKGRKVDAWYMRYHAMRRQYLGLSKQREAYFNCLTPKDFIAPAPDIIVDNLNCREVWQAVEEWRPDLTFVSGTKYIGKKLNERGGLMINLHIGALPEYKGNHCIFFALYNGAVDKVAATLHVLTPELDGGAVLEKAVPPILANDTEETLYTRCLHMAIDRCVEHIVRFSSGEKVKVLPQSQAGETFRHSDRTLLKELVLWWKLRIGGLLRGYNHDHIAKPLMDDIDKKYW